MNPIYVPSEDSFLMSKYVERLVEGSVLDMGTGSGIQAVTAARKKKVTSVVAVDIDPEALFATRRLALKEGVVERIQFVESDLFTAVKGEYNWIIFNPPYLPSEEGLSDLTWDGGRGGAKVIIRFLNEAKWHLTKGGSILLIFSSETEFNGDYGYEWLTLEKLQLFFETLFCAQLSPISPA